MNFDEFCLQCPRKAGPYCKHSGKVCEFAGCSYWFNACKIKGQTEFAHFLKWSSGCEHRQNESHCTLYEDECVMEECEPWEDYGDETGLFTALNIDWNASIKSGEIFNQILKMPQPKPLTSARLKSYAAAKNINLIHGGNDGKPPF